MVINQDNGSGHTLQETATSLLGLLLSHIPSHFHLMPRMSCCLTSRCLPTARSSTSTTAMATQCTQRTEGASCLPRHLDPYARQLPPPQRQLSSLLPLYLLALVPALQIRLTTATSTSTVIPPRPPSSGVLTALPPVLMRHHDTPSRISIRLFDGCASMLLRHLHVHADQQKVHAAYPLTGKNDASQDPTGQVLHSEECNVSKL